MEQLTALITDLIRTKTEGQYWDFKELPHENKAALLHDILCLANTRHQGNRFLIFGVTDPSDGAKVVGLNSSTLNRKTQQEYIDFLRSKSFAGNIRPEIALHTLDIDGKEIDVLVIINHPLKPYYLSKFYQDDRKLLQGNAIHTRIGDTNTPINEAADLIHVEQMWRERFYLDTPPSEKMSLLLRRPSEWQKNMGNADYAYHQLNPEYNIKFSAVEKFESKEAYCYYYLDPVSRLGTAKFYYHSTLLFEQEYMTCDGFKIYLPVPETQYLSDGDTEQWYHYYCLSGISGIFLQFLTDNHLSFSTGRGSKPPFLIFRDKDEQQAFDNLAQAKLKDITKISLSTVGRFAVNEKSKANDQSVIDPGFLDQISQFREGLKS